MDKNNKIKWHSLPLNIEEQKAKIMIAFLLFEMFFFKERVMFSLFYWYFKFRFSLLFRHNKFILNYGSSFSYLIPFIYTDLFITIFHYTSQFCKSFFKMRNWFSAQFPMQSFLYIIMSSCLLTGLKFLLPD